MRRKYPKEIYENKELQKEIFEKYLSGKSFVTISKEIGLPAWIITKIYKDNGGIVRTDREQALKYTCNDDFFEVIDTEEKAYWLGFMYADGYIVAPRKYNTIRVGISITKGDKNHLEKFKKTINFTGKIHDYNGGKSKYKGSKPYCRILISSPKMAQDLIDKGCIIEKTDKLKYPSTDIVPKHLEKHFIRGLIDGDGSITINTKGTHDTYCLKFTGTENMCRGILHFFCKDSITLDKRHKDSDNDNYSFSLGGNYQVKVFLDILYGNATIYLDRKYQRYLSLLELSRTWK